MVVAIALICPNLYPVRSQILSTDEGVWEHSWKRDYGWSHRVYQEWGYVPSIRMISWNRDGLLYNGRLIVCVTLAVLIAALALLCTLQEVSACRPVIRDS